MAMRVEDVMTPAPRTVASSASVVEAARLMRDEDVGALPVADDGQVVGVVTDRDLVVRVLAEGADPESTRVADVTSGGTVTVTPDQDLEEALRLMASHQVRRLPVVEGDRLVGILAQADVAQAGDAARVGEVVEAISEGAGNN
jgi:CBS domain-containing protein